MPPLFLKTRDYRTLPQRLADSNAKKRKVLKIRFSSIINFVFMSFCASFEFSEARRCVVYSRKLLDVVTYKLCHHPVMKCSRKPRINILSSRDLTHLRHEMPDVYLRLFRPQTHSSVFVRAVIILETMRTRCPWWISHVGELSHLEFTQSRSETFDSFTFSTCITENIRLSFFSPQTCMKYAVNFPLADVQHKFYVFTAQSNQKSEKNAGKCKTNAHNPTSRVEFNFSLFRTLFLDEWGQFCVYFRLLPMRLSLHQRAETVSMFRSNEPESRASFLWMKS